MTTSKLLITINSCKCFISLLLFDLCFFFYNQTGWLQKITWAASFIKTHMVVCGRPETGMSWLYFGVSLWESVRPERNSILLILHHSVALCEIVWLHFNEKHEAFWGSFPTFSVTNKNFSQFNHPLTQCDAAFEQYRTWNNFNAENILVYLGSVSFFFF